MNHTVRGLGDVEGVECQNSLRAESVEFGRALRQRIGDRELLLVSIDIKMTVATDLMDVLWNVCHAEGWRGVGTVLYNVATGEQSKQVERLVVRRKGEYEEARMLLM